MTRFKYTLYIQAECLLLWEEVCPFSFSNSGSVYVMLTLYHEAETAPDVKEKYGIKKEGAAFEDLFKDTPELCGQTCAFLASGKGKELRGFYVDCRQDVGKLLEVGREGLKSKGLNTLGVKFLDGYCNEP
jgi:hypothetical protein